MLTYKIFRRQTLILAAKAPVNLRTLFRLLIAALNILLVYATRFQVSCEAAELHTLEKALAVLVQTLGSEH